MPEGRLRPPYAILSEREWNIVRVRYEAGGISQRRLAAEFKMSNSTLMKRAQREKWRQGRETGPIVEAAKSFLEAELFETGKTAAHLAARHIVDELAPWIAEQKITQVKRAVERSTRGQLRLDKACTTTNEDGQAFDVKLAPKDIGYLAAAEDKFDAIIRRNLGMSDAGPIGGPINVSVLANQAAIQVVTKQ